MSMTKLYHVSVYKIKVAWFLIPLDTLVRATFQSATASQSACSCFTLIHPLFTEYTYFAGLFILFHPSNWVSTILNRQLVYQSQLSLRTALRGVSVKPLDEYAYWSVLQQGLPIISSVWTVIYISLQKKEKAGIRVCERDSQVVKPQWSKPHSQGAEWDPRFSHHPLPTVLSNSEWSILGVPVWVTNSFLSL